MQTEPPYWLEEAYSSAIAPQDVGIMHRNLANCEVTSAIIRVLFPSSANAIDFGAGHGVFVRLMRDRGFNFSWMDRYAANDYARGFEYEPGLRYDFLTAFEVLEHLPDPIANLSELMNLSDNIFVSTCLLPEPTPTLSDWWYYSPTTGQHVSFYTKQALQIVADRFGRRLLSHGPYHLFTRTQCSKALFNLATRIRLARGLGFRRPSLMNDDLQKMIS